MSMPVERLLIVRYWGTAAGRETWSVPSSNVMVVGVRHSLDHPRYRHFVTILKNTVKDQSSVFPAREAGSGA